MLITTTTCDIQKVTAFQESILLTFSKFFDFITGLIAVPITLYALGLCIKSHRFHINFRMIGVMHCFCLFVHCAGRVIQNTSAIYLWLFKKPVCEQRMYFETCVIVRLTYIFGLYSSSLSSLFMCVERTIATKFFRKYENKNWQLGVFLVFLQTFLSFLITFFYYENAVLDERPSFCFFEIPRPYTVFCETLMIVVNVLAFWQCKRLNRINTTIRNQRNSIALGQKFQVEENKMLTKVMNQFTILSFISMITFFTFGGFQHSLQNFMPTPTFLAVFELIHCVPVHAIIMLILMMKSIEKLRAQQSQEFVKVVRTKEEAYFQYLIKEWK